MAVVADVSGTAIGCGAVDCGSAVDIHRPRNISERSNAVDPNACTSPLMMVWDGANHLTIPAAVAAAAVAMRCDCDF